VRFLLSPPPEDERAIMKTRSSSQIERIVLPSARKEEEWKFGPANAWNREQLQKLGVTHMRKKWLDLDKFLDVNESEFCSGIDGMVGSCIPRNRIAEERAYSAISQNVSRQFMLLR